jgi:hypothetical protein
MNRFLIVTTSFFNPILQSFAGRSEGLDKSSTQPKPVA